jgi:hypothetical protein
MNTEDLCQNANNAKTENFECENGRVKCSTSRNIQGFLSQKGFLLCESCFWCASLVYRIEDNIEIPPFLQCPNCYSNKVELLTSLIIVEYDGCYACFGNNIQF